jgi:hypothetical protein
MNYVFVTARNENTSFYQVEYKGKSFLRLPLYSPRSNGCLIINLTPIENKYVFTLRLSDDQGSICDYFEYENGTKDLNAFVIYALTEIKQYIWRKSTVIQDIQNMITYSNIAPTITQDNKNISSLFEATVESQEAYLKTNLLNEPQIC